MHLINHGWGVLEFPNAVVIDDEFLGEWLERRREHEPDDYYIDEDDVCVPCSPTCTPGESLCSGERIVRCDDASGCAHWGDPTHCTGGLACSEGECVELCVDADADGFPIDCPGERVDCDDSRGDVFPRAWELCDGIDNDCDGTIDEQACDEPCEDECTPGTRECTGDASGRVECEPGPDGCARPSGIIACRGAQICVDGDCVDEVVCVDRDGDGHGPGCDDGADCRPHDATVFAGAEERCDGLDGDCDGVIDDGGVCLDCVAAPPGAPVALAAGETAHRFSCGGFEHFALSGAPAGARLSAVVGSAGGRLEFEYGALADGRFAAAGDGWPIGESSAALWNAGGAPAVRVSAPAGLAYAVAVSAEHEGWTCGVDAFEPNNTPGTGAEIGALPHVGAGQLCGGEVDFYRIDAAPGDTIAASVVFEGEPSRDLFPKIWRNGVEISPSFAGPFGDAGLPNGRRAHFRADLPGTYAVAVRGLTPATTNDYALSIVSIADAGCADDAAERADGLDDDTLETARALARGATAEGTLCPGDFDVISVGRLADGQQFSATFEYDDRAGNLDFVMLRGSWRSLFHDGESDDARVEFSTNVSTAGNYFIVVYGRSAHETADYSFSFEVR